jgi:hypothetical protein
MTVPRARSPSINAFEKSPNAKLTTLERCVMVTTHDAGLMLIPALMPLQEHAEHMYAVPVIDSMWNAALAVPVHIAMLAVTGAIVLIVVGLGALRRGWINLDLVGTPAFIAIALVLLLTTQGCLVVERLFTPVPHS